MMESRNAGTAEDHALMTLGGLLLPDTADVASTRTRTATLFDDNGSAAHSAATAIAPAQDDGPISDLTDAQWESVARVLPPRNQRGRPIGDQRRILNGIRYVLHTGCAWDKLPACYGSHITCWRWYMRWQSNGAWQRIQQVLLEHQHNDLT